MKFEVAVCREVKPDIFSWLIMKFSGKPYSHAFVIVDEEIIFECVEKGVVKSAVADLLKGGAHVIVDRVQVFPSYYPRQGCRACVDRDAYGYLRGSIGISYSQMQIPAFILKFLRKFVRNGRSRMICSEFVAWFLKEGLGHLHEKLEDCDFVSPEEVLAIARSLPKGDNAL